MEKRTSYDSGNTSKKTITHTQWRITYAQLYQIIMLKR